MILFYPGPHETVLRTSDQPMPAIVTYEHHHRHNDAYGSPLINVAAFSKDGALYSRQSVHIWDGEGDAPERGSYARWQEDDESEAVREENANAPKRAFGETEEAHKSRLDKWRAERGDMREQRRATSAVRRDGQAHTNVDHGPPRSWGQSPNAGGPMAIDDHEPRPGMVPAPARPAFTPPFQGAPSGGMQDRPDMQGRGNQEARLMAADKDKAAADKDAADAKATADKRAADEAQKADKADKAAKAKAADKSP
jgi:hypothetical protein